MASSRLNCSQFVVGVHHGDQHGLGAKGPLDVRRIDGAARAHTHVGHLDASFLERLARVEHGVMLDDGGDDVLFFGARRLHDSPDGGVVGFRASAGEDNLAGARVEQASHLLARLLRRGLRLLAVPVDRRGVAVIFREIGPHRLENFRCHGRGRAVVKIDSAHALCFLRVVSR